MKKIKLYKMPSASETIKTEIVCANDTNPMGLLQGGRLVEWMDIAAAVCAQTHAEKICVTACINKVDFFHPAHIGDIITIRANITRAFNTSMEIVVEAFGREVTNKQKYSVGKAYFIFVAIDENKQATSVHALNPSTQKQRDQFQKALQRKELSEKNKLIYS